MGPAPTGESNEPASPREPVQRSELAGFLLRMGILFGVLTVAAVVAAISIPGVVSARPQANEAAAVGALKTIVTAQTAFLEQDLDGDGARQFGDLAALGRARVIDEVLATGTKQGYLFQCRPGPLTPELLWAAAASPMTPGVSGARYFYTNHSGVIWHRLDRPYDLSDPLCGPPPGQEYPYASQPDAAR